MKIIKAIRWLYQNLHVAWPVAGEGINIEHTKTGSIISLEPQANISDAASQGGQAWPGMFTIVKREFDMDDPEWGSDYIRIEDTTDAAEKTDPNDSDSLPRYAGIPHVNGIAFDQLPSAVFTPGATLQGHHYIYLHFNAGSVVDDVSEDAGIGHEGETGTPPAFELLCVKEAKTSTFTDLYYLIGRVVFGKEEVELDNGVKKTYYTVESISQDHFPGPVYLTWYGPDIGIAQEAIYGE